MKLHPDTITKLTHNLNTPKILVVGDVILDRYWFGTVDRISPEAPVPVAKINKIDDRPGGAANVARNIASLGGNVTLLSVVGFDEVANNLEKILINDKVDVFFKHDRNINTIMKLRVLAKNQQLIRLDFEEQPSHEILLEILDEYEKIIADYAVVILSDYGKGGLAHITRLIEIANNHKKIILVDPKGKDYSKYANATLLTPNKSELYDAVGHFADEQDMIKKAILLKQQLQLKNLLLTRSEEGMTLFYDEQKMENYPTLAKEVYDVSGAGDTVIASLALMLANNINTLEAVWLANIAAGIVVGKLGTATVTKEELITKVNNPRP